MNKRTVLLVEDNAKLNDGNRRALEFAGYAVTAAFNLAQARERLAASRPDVILLDVMLPDGDGFDFCGEIREHTDAHIIFLTARGEHEAKLRGLSIGGDDYITKPFSPDELLTRVAAAMRRRDITQSASAPAKTLTMGGLTLDFIAGRAYVNGADLLLKPKEFALLRFFAENEDKTLSAETVYAHVWAQPMLDDSRTLRNRVSELRSKLAEAGCGYTVANLYGKGYRFEKV